MNVTNEKIVTIELPKEGENTMTHFLDPSFHSEALKKEAEIILLRDFGNNEEAKKRFNEETSIIDKEGYWDHYWLANESFKEAKRLDEPIAWRKHSLDTFVGYLLGWSPVNPLNHDMPFARLVGEEGKGVPGFSLGLSGDGVEKVQSHLRDLLGKEKVLRATKVDGRFRHSYSEYLLIIPYNHKAEEFTPVMFYRDQSWWWGCLDYEEELKKRLYAIEIIEDFSAKEVHALRESMKKTTTLEELTKKKTVSLAYASICRRAIDCQGVIIKLPEPPENLDEYLETYSFLAQKIRPENNEFTEVYSQANMKTGPKVKALRQQKTLIGIVYIKSRNTKISIMVSCFL